MSAARLGSVPAGLEWLVNKKQNNKDAIEVQEQSFVPVEAEITSQADKPNAAPSKALERYQQHLKETEQLYMQMLETKLTGQVQGSCDSIKSTKKSSVQLGLADGWTRATIIVKQEHIKKLKCISKKHDVSLKDLVNIALSKFLSTM